MQSHEGGGENFEHARGGMGRSSVQGGGFTIPMICMKRQGI